MFCSSCGKKIKEGASFCEKCGKPVPKITTKAKINGLGLAGFICSLAGIITCGITSIVGFVISLISFILNKQKGNKDRYSLAGLIISSITILLIIIFYAIMLFTAKTVKVCDFSVKTYDEAVKYCKNSTLSCNVLKTYSKTVPEGSFINQDVPAGKKVKTYNTVNVEYSKGAKKQTSSNVTSNTKKNTTKKKKKQKKVKKIKCEDDSTYMTEYENIFNDLYPYGHKVSGWDWKKVKTSDTECQYYTTIKITNMYGAKSKHHLYINTTIDQNKKEEHIRSLMVDNEYVYEK